MFDTFLPIVSVVAVYIARIVELNTKRDTVAGPVLENLTYRLFLLTGTVMFVGSLAEYVLKHQTLVWWTFLLGWTCALASFWLRRNAIRALGRFWSLHVEIRQNHEFVKSGPFRWMRHPTYFSMILELVALGLILNAFTMLAIVPVLFIPALALRLKLEETALVDKFGDDYREYQRVTPALIPYRWPRSN